MSLLYLFRLSCIFERTSEQQPSFRIAKRKSREKKCRTQIEQSEHPANRINRIVKGIDDFVCLFAGFLRIEHILTAKKKSECGTFFSLYLNYDVHVSIVKCVLFMVQRVYTTSWYFLPRRRFKQICYTIQIACSRTVAAASMFVFYQTCLFKIFKCKVNCLSVNAALCSDKLSWRVASHVIIAMPKQTTVHCKLSWF